MTEPRGPRPPHKNNLRPWLAPSLGTKPSARTAKGAGAFSVESLSYIVVDEIVGEGVGLSVSPWPGADDKGRLRFDLSKTREIGVDTGVFCKFLQAKGIDIHPIVRRGEELGKRRLRIGDAFAAEITGTRAMWTKPLNHIVPGPVHDLTKDARVVAKLAYYGAVAQEWDKDKADTYGLTDLAEESG